MPQEQPNIAMDSTSLYREETYTDRKVGTIRMLLPVTPAGATDESRPIVFTGEAQLMSQMGPVPLNFEIEAQSLAQAIVQYGPAAQAAIARTIQEINDMRRQAASSLVVPGAAGAAGFGAAGFGAGSKIQLP
jgi:hypothetical protein